MDMEKAIKQALVDDLTRLRAEVETLRRVRDAAVSLLREFERDTRGVLWTGEAAVVGLRAALDAAKDG